MRVNANDPNASALNGGAVDPDLRPFRQTEFTVGAERQLNQDYVVRVRYTYKNVDEAVEDAGIVNPAGSEAYIIGNPGRGLHLQTLQALGYAKSTRPQRRYDGLEFVLDKRLSNNFYFNVNYTLSRLYGNYSDWPVPMSPTWLTADSLPELVAHLTCLSSDLPQKVRRTMVGSRLTDHTSSTSTVRIFLIG